MKSAKIMEYGGYGFALSTALAIRLTGISPWWLVAVIIFIFVWGGYFRRLGRGKQGIARIKDICAREIPARLVAPSYG